MKLKRVAIDPTPNGYDRTASVMVGISSFLSFASIWFSLQSLSHKREAARTREAEIRTLDEKLHAS